MTFPLPTALLERLRLVREGAEVLIRYTGMQTSKAGRPFKGFEVFVAGVGPAEPTESAAPAGSLVPGAPSQEA